MLTTVAALGAGHMTEEPSMTAESAISPGESPPESSRRRMRYSLQPWLVGTCAACPLALLLRHRLHREYLARLLVCGCAAVLAVMPIIYEASTQRSQISWIASATLVGLVRSSLNLAVRSTGDHGPGAAGDAWIAFSHTSVLGETCPPVFADMTMLNDLGPDDSDGLLRAFGGLLRASLTCTAADHEGHARGDDRRECGTRDGSPPAT